MTSNKKIYLEKIQLNKNALQDFIFETEKKGGVAEKVLLRYPTVYIAEESNKQGYSVYIGETADIYRRTLQHLDADAKTNADWQNLSQSNNAALYVIAHEYFNKSLTLDIENRLMMYLASVPNVEKIYNKRTNQQNQYYTSDQLDSIFAQVWRKLRQDNPELFPLERIIKDKALFKASPFHKLSQEQENAKLQIKNTILTVLKTTQDQADSDDWDQAKTNSETETGKLILVTGAAGSGKTVLLSSLFYDLFQNIKDEDDHYNFDDLDNYLLVNHDEQLIVYQEIAQKLNLIKDNAQRVSKPTSFINNRSENEDKVDVALVDEAHLLWTQGKQAYRGQNQLKDIVARSRVTVAIFDSNQVLRGNQFWEEDSLKALIESADSHIHLRRQMRINANEETQYWLKELIHQHTILPIPNDDAYDLKIFSSPQELEAAIRAKDKDQTAGISRLTATFDWEYKQKTPPKEDSYWMVKEDGWQMPWNLQLKENDKIQKRRNRHLSWAEQPHTIGEVGSTYTIQGFDLNYAGVIIGPSVKYRDGKVIFDRDGSRNKDVIRNRKLADGQMADVSSQLLNNELNVLLTRGVNGLYIYAVDDQLRQALLDAQEQRKKAQYDSH